MPSYLKPWSVLAVACAGVVCTSVVMAQPMLYAPGAPYMEASPPMVMPPANSGPLQYETYYGGVNPGAMPGAVPGAEYQTLPIEPYMDAHAPQLYPNVVYRDVRKIHPHAVPYLVQVPLPQPRNPCLSCGPTCALVKICVPPCKEPCVKVRLFGHKLKYDFGKYEVDVVVRRDGRVIVDYDR